MGGRWAGGGGGRWERGLGLRLRFGLVRSQILRFGSIRERGFDAILGESIVETAMINILLRGACSACNTTHVLQADAPT